MYKHLISKHEEHQVFKRHHNNQMQCHHLKKPELKNPIKILGIATIAGFIIGLLTH
jgi:hypothetical protein